MCAERLEIFYDGRCPTCRRAIGAVRHRLAEHTYRAIDIADEGFDARAHGLDPADVRRELHVRCPGGEVARGIDAVIVLWRRIGGAWGLIGRLCALPLAHGLAAKCYRWFAAWRHLIGP